MFQMLRRYDPSCRTKPRATTLNSASMQKIPKKYTSVSSCTAKCTAINNWRDPAKTYTAVPNLICLRSELIPHWKRDSSASEHYAGCPLFYNIDFPWLFHDQKMKVHDLSAQHIFPSKRYTTYECIPELVVTVPSARSTIVKKIRRFTIWLYKWSRVTFTELLSAVVKIPRHYHHFLRLFHEICYFPWLSKPGKWSS